MEFYIGFTIIALMFVTILFVVALSFFSLRRSLDTWLEFRGARVITCPENLQAAGVNVDTRHAALSAFLHSEPDLRLSSCTRWPENAGCAQLCLEQIEAAPHDCSVRFILDSWYAGKPCVYCRKRFGQIQWHDHKPALVSPEGVFLDWKDIPHQKLQEILVTHFPVCWNCDAIERFRLEHPDLVTEVIGRDKTSGVIR